MRVSRELGDDRGRSEIGAVAGVSGAVGSIDAVPRRSEPEHDQLHRSLRLLRPPAEEARRRQLPGEALADVLWEEGDALAVGEEDRHAVRRLRIEEPLIAKSE